MKNKYTLDHPLKDGNIKKLSWQVFGALLKILVIPDQVKIFRIYIYEIVFFIDVNSPKIIPEIVNKNLQEL